MMKVMQEVELAEGGEEDTEGADRYQIKPVVD